MQPYVCGGVPNDVRVGPLSLSPGTYNATCRTFGWDRARAQLDGLPDGALNIAHEAVDRHVAVRRVDHVAHSVAARSGEARRPHLRRTPRADQSVRRCPGGARPRARRAARHAGRARPELYVAVARHPQGRRGVLAAVLGVRSRPDPPAHRSRSHRGARHHRVVVPAQGRADASRAAEPAPRPPHRRRRRADRGGHGRGRRLLAAASPGVRHRADPARRPRPAALHQRHHRARPKGAMHVHEAVVAHHATGRAWCSTCIPATCSGAPPIPAG